ncbi:MAG: M20/M25/M40 family metallo-hydrolase [Chitinophagaceae bacterium]|nr:MAG: M20/M25/M40 family metallo-hydrolase [Chitinophagaceae bacterium]
MRIHSPYQYFKKILRSSSLLLAMFTGLNGFAQKQQADSIITADLLRGYVKALSHDSMQGRHTGTKGCTMAAAYIASEMKAIRLQSLQTGDSNYYSNYIIEKDGEDLTVANIVGLLPGKISDQFIVFSAHYDHVGDAGDELLPSQIPGSRKDRLFNGANDNASGVAALLALARYYQQAQTNEFSILFIAFSGEEDGLLGSEAMAGSFPQLNRIKQVINLEMLGRLSAKNKKPFVTEGISSYGFAKKLNRHLSLSGKAFEENYFSTDGYVTENNFSRSDNYSFAIRGIPANTIMATGGFDRYYHTAWDEWQTLNYDAMSQIVRAIALACTPLLMTSSIH